VNEGEQGCVIKSFFLSAYLTAPIGQCVCSILPAVVAASLVSRRCRLSDKSKENCLLRRPERVVGSGEMRGCVVSRRSR
jgi:hypothetical protein